MINLKVNEAKSQFFDRVMVLAKTDQATAKNLSKAGAFVRRKAKGLIVKSKNPSKPGRPPHSHVGTLRDLIFFVLDSGGRSVLVGPVLSNRPSGAPYVLEIGGENEVYVSRGKRKRTVYIPKRPYMGPALQSEMPKFPELWANSVKL
jgi:hypothetical protein